MEVYFEHLSVSGPSLALLSFLIENPRYLSNLRPLNSHPTLITGVPTEVPLRWIRK